MSNHRGSTERVRLENSAAEDSSYLWASKVLGDQVGRVTSPRPPRNSSRKYRIARDTRGGREEAAERSGGGGGGTGGGGKSAAREREKVEVRVGGGG
ncbi:hypothetical protein PR202_gb02691 [Eleusine coracana subsp. coracana]|uniref:Uncharacterized protein n=1 Tax=Eleusine coracana subsp. coracana TaxID=191504 RepID=A0AAV5DYY6_ELECO|nr:hypothetical protein PR202_gb02691 [Eleusine coracana subsp. coracana]